MSDLNRTEIIGQTKEDQNVALRLRKRLVSMVLVGCNVALLAGVGVAYTDKELRTVPTVAQVNESVRGGGAMNAQVAQPSPFGDMVHTLGGLITAGRLDERTAARLYALTLIAGRDALRTADEAAAVDEMVNMAASLLEGGESVVELYAFRQRHNPTSSQSFQVRSPAQLPGDTEFDNYVQALRDGSGGVGQWAAMPRIGGTASGTQCEALTGAEALEQTAASAAGPEDLLFYAGGKGTPGLAGIWLQMSVAYHEASDESSLIEALAEYATRWYDLTISLASAELSGETASQPAAAAWLWWVTTGSKVEGAVRVRPWSDLLLESPKVTNFASAHELVRRAAAVGLRSGVDTDTSFTLGVSFGTCGAVDGAVRR